MRKNPAVGSSIERHTAEALPKMTMPANAANARPSRDPSKRAMTTASRPIDSSFPVPHVHFATVEVDVLHPQRQALEQPQPGTMEQIADQTHRAAQLRENRGCLGLRQHDWQANGPMRSDERCTPIRWTPEHVPVEKQQRAQCLVLRGRADAPVARQHRQKRQHLRLVESAWMPKPRKHDVPSRPSNIRLLGAAAVVARADHPAQTVEKLRAGAWVEAETASRCPLTRKGDDPSIIALIV